MNGTRNTSYVVSLALLASLVGHFAIQKYFARSWRTQVAQAESDSRPVPIVDLNPRSQGFERIYGGSPQKSRERGAGRSIIPVQDIQTEDFPARPNRNGNPSTVVPVPGDALSDDLPSAERPAVRDENSSQVREVIERELAGSTSEERDIWFEELKSLPAGVVADLLQVRRQLHGLPKLLGGMPEKLVSTDPAIVPRAPEVTAEPVSQRIRFNTYNQHFATEALEVAAAQMRHNLVNAATPGFKRLRVTIIDVYSENPTDGGRVDANKTGDADDQMIVGEGCRVGRILIDTRQGVFKKTGRNLDLSIDGQGFFVVKRGEQQYLTRCGAFTLDHDRQLCLAASLEDAVLQPAIKIPEDSTEIQITVDGIVAARNSESLPFAEIGQLQLAFVASPERLQPVGSTLLLANEDSGNAITGDPSTGGRGKIQQGSLELSNVDVEHELAEIEELSQILKAIPQQSGRSATARSPQQNPNR